MQSYFEFLVSAINHYHINGLHLFSDNFEWFCLQTSSDAKYFLLSCASRINSCYTIFKFETEKKTKLLWVIISSHMGSIYIETHYIIISSRIISSRMGSVYIETPYIIMSRIISSHWDTLYYYQ